MGLEFINVLFALSTYRVRKLSPEVFMLYTQGCRVGKLKRNNFPVCHKLEKYLMKNTMMTQCLRRGMTLTVCCLCSAAVSKGFVCTTNGASSASGFVGSVVSSKSTAASFLSHDGGRLFFPSELRHYDKVAPTSCFMFDFFVRVYVKSEFTPKILGLQLENREL